MSNVTKKYHLLEQFSVRNKTGLLLVLLYFVLIGIEKSRHSLNQSDKKLNPITTWSPTFSRALCCCFGFSLSFYRLLRVSFLLIYFGFAFTILSLKALYMSALIKTESEYSPFNNRYYYFFTYMLSYFVQGSSLFSVV